MGPLADILNIKGSESLQAVSKCPSATIMGFGLVFLFVVFFIFQIVFIVGVILTSQKPRNYLIKIHHCYTDTEAHYWQVLLRTRILCVVHLKV